MNESMFSYLLIQKIKNNQNFISYVSTISGVILIYGFLLMTLIFKPEVWVNYIGSLAVAALLIFWGVITGN
jgi:hypothetical protein